MSTTKKNLIDMSLDEIIKTNKKKGGFKVGMKKKGNVKKTSQIAKVANKSKGIRKSKVGLKNPVEAARKRTQIAAATLTAKRRLNKFGVKNIVDKGAIRAIVAEVLKSKTLNRIKVPKRKLTNNSVCLDYQNNIVLMCWG
uniref:Uncharacterized protein n=1 Tax=Parastrongyloides trichosuri TaxID=131310 RepID=A0A0N4ZE33_PARTI